ncbi:MAG TPA: hypothetical protein VL356_02305 [Acidocella sp.]|jgi:hypothetical protein|nr:hypothetical protein [Acidocella sp.]
MAHYWAPHDAKADEIDLAVRVALGAVLLHLHFDLRLDSVITAAIWWFWRCRRRSRADVLGEGRLDEREAWLRLPS